VAVRSNRVGDTIHTLDEKHARKKTPSFWLRFANASPNAPTRRLLSEHRPIVAAGVADSLSGG